MALSNALLQLLIIGVFLFRPFIIPHQAIQGGNPPLTKENTCSSSVCLLRACAGLSCIIWWFVSSTQTHINASACMHMSFITWVTHFTASTSCHPVGGAVRYSDRLDFLKILFHIRPERLEKDRCCQTMMDEPLLKGHQGNNRQPSEPWKHKLSQDSPYSSPSSPQLSAWKMSAIRKYANVKVVSLLMCHVLK